MHFESVYKAYYQELYYFAIRQDLTPPEAADILQDIFTALYKQMQTGALIENPRAWLYNALLNSVRTRYRTLQSRQEKNIDYASGIDLVQDTQADLNDRERRRIVEACLSTMEPDDKNLLLLYHKGFSYKEIAETLRINYSSVGTNIARSTKKLTSILKSQYHELFE